MKGIVLAGGTGSRLLPLTKVTNKHLLPVYNKPMIYYPLQTLIDAGIKDILIISGPGHAGHFVNLLGSGRDLGVKLSYEIQDEAGGIAQALGLAEDFADEGPVCVVLGDNIFQDKIDNLDFLKKTEGTISGNMNLDGPFTAPQLSGQIKLKDGRIKSEVLTKGSARFLGILPPTTKTSLSFDIRDINANIYIEPKGAGRENSNPGYLFGDAIVL